MPLPSGTRYRMKKTAKGMIRLAFGKGSNKVIEAKNMKTGDTSSIMKKVRGRRSR